MPELTSHCQGSYSDRYREKQQLRFPSSVRRIDKYIKGRLTVVKAMIQSSQPTALMNRRDKSREIVIARVMMLDIQKMARIAGPRSSLCRVVDSTMLITKLNFDSVIVADTVRREATVTQGKLMLHR